MKTIAIIISAYEAEKFILDCIEAVKKQQRHPEWIYDLRIGVDGCFKTAQILHKHKINYFYSAENHGAYIIRNSLIYLKPADAYVYFDADDIMCRDFMYQICNKLSSGEKIVLPAKLQCDQFMKPKSYNPVIESGGSMAFTHEVLESLGGYYRWRCAGDTDFMYRAKMAGFKICEITKGLYMRRRHDGSLTRGGITRMGSSYRKTAWQEMTEKREQGIIKIVPTVVELEKK